MSGISAIYILDQKGKILITRAYRADVPTNIHEKFNQKLFEYDETTIKPIISIDKGITFFHTRHNNICFLAVTKKNSNATMVFSFIYKIIDVFTEYFKEVEEESIRDNFVVIYELLDEMMDNGYPQLTEVKMLQEYIKTEYHQLKSDKKDAFQTQNLALPQGTMDIVSWRPPGIKHKKNEVFLDVIEKLNMLIGTNGQTIKCEIQGTLKMKTFLTGMPELKLGLNDKALFEATGRSTRGKAVDLEDIKFHHCVKLTKFENERIINFIPPDGEFDLMSYRLDMNVKPLFSVDCQHEFKTQTKIDYYVKIKSNYRSRNTANNVVVLIPVPCDAQVPTFKTATGSVSYMAEKDSMAWTVKHFPGQKEFVMKASFSLPTITSKDRLKFEKMPISIEFEIPYFTVSGINVRYLKITEKSGYTALPWVRYITENGDYHIRMQ
jgi:AP-1 complex subunit mu